MNEFIACVGLGFGDEGKGLVTDYLCSQKPNHTMVMRFSGGHQCHHTVNRDKIQHIFANFGSGTLLGCPTYWGVQCTFEPTGFIKEYNILKEKGANPKIYIHPMCPVTTTFDIEANHLSEERKHGTTGTGFFKTLERHRKVSLTVMDIARGPDDHILKLKLDTVINYYKGRQKDSIDLHLGKLYESLKQFKELIGDSIEITENIPQHNRFVFEGSQGLLLDQRIGFFPHVTPSNTSILNIVRDRCQLKEVYYVTRAYQTRHGSGPMTNEDLPLKLKDTPEETNVLNEFQGEFRRTVLDLDLLKYGLERGRIDKNIPANLVVTCLDQIRGTYQLTHNRELKNFHTKKGFIRYIAKALDIEGRLFGSKGPTAEDIFEIKGET